MADILSINGYQSDQVKLDWPEQVDGHIVRIERRLSEDDSRWKEVEKGFNTARDWILDLESRIEKLEKKKWWQIWHL